MTAANSSQRLNVLLMLALIRLTCAAATLIDDDDLKELKENIQTLRREAQRQRVNYMLDGAFIPDIFEDLGHFMVLLSKVLKRITPFPPLLDLIQDTKFLMKEAKKYMEQVVQNEDAKVRDNEERLRQIEKLIMTLEEWRS